ncbi:hypothetical protein Kpol_1054p31 [Vanderwaltozyma polyspora DSM 70294]|uniref:2,4-dienoyl-CoA reductase [(3E)-enoyl-CoA-producing] n=1 Tax=Vanderwaltozyma polyspora (strain ATCC 22028 / DSM 70294 / BCRC 21397 / CBS 2163 / NBRC 10782 / NRRL Y-8283 / UCD 57-17) TaxID=436907 RepID=A7TIB8_VANPO|nr:uncharacterized protein Kpol_1054p31 [Vanderwaltozyma polyspora DSM 70294]EDO17984.1 hypothetical protein Kpol_1054p31 [Vanderwaltozyma polyspora DSM 70294]
MVNTLDSTFVSQSSWKPDLFKGKVAFVTGGAGTICRVQVEALVLLGCKAAIIGRNNEKTIGVAKEISSLVPKGSDGTDAVLPIGNVDVRNPEHLQDAVKKTVDTFGRIDFVIAGAAGNFICDIANLSPNAFKSVISIDLLGSFNTIKACFNELVKSKGSIIFVSATFHYYGVPFQSHVGAAKAGIDSLSSSIAVEWGPLGIRSNCIAPGAIGGTEGLKRLVLKEFEENGADKIPLQRLGSTKDIAEATVFLFSPSSAYITGTVQIVDGGMWHLGTTFGDKMYPKYLMDSMKSKL